MLPTGAVRHSFFDPQQHLDLQDAAILSRWLDPGPYHDYVWFGDRRVGQSD
jgi:hypothetical protein